MTKIKRKQKKVDLQLTKKIIAEIVEENPHFIYRKKYKQCKYFANGKYPACIVGHFFRKLGVENMPPGTNKNSITGLKVSGVLSYDLNLDIDSESINYLKNFQNKQDETFTLSWSDIKRSVDVDWPE